MRSDTNFKANEDINKPLCFVIMPFGSWFDAYYRDIYKTAIENADYSPKRADDIYRPCEVMKDIWTYIKTADILLADLTTKNPNVFYELGLAHARGKTVILTTPSPDDVPFDLKHIRFIVYEKNDPNWGDQLRIKLTEALKTAKKDPSEYRPSIFDDPDDPDLNLHGALQKALNRCSHYNKVRIYAHSSGNISGPIIEMLKRKGYFSIDECQIILRQFKKSELDPQATTDESMLMKSILKRNRNEYEAIKKHIGNWRPYQNIKFYGIDHELSDYYVIFDDLILIAGIYFQDNDVPSLLDYTNTLYIDCTNSNVGSKSKKIIEGFIRRFDDQTNILKPYDTSL